MNVQCVLTPGVQSLEIHTGSLSNMFKQSIEYYEKSYMTVYEPINDHTRITDGNENHLGDLRTSLPTTVWIIADDYGDRVVFTALLPEEY